MPKVMRKVMVNRVDMVDRGSNPEAHIAIFKRDEGGDVKPITVQVSPITLTDELWEEFKNRMSKTKVTEGVVKPMTFEELLKSLNADQQALIQAEIQKRSTPTVEPSAEEFFKGWPKEAREAFEKMKKDNEMAVSQMKKMAEDARKETFIAKAANLSNLSVEATSFGEKMAKVADVDSDLANEIFETLNAANEAAKNLMAEYGAPMDTEGGRAAHDQIVVKAVEIRKGQPSLTEQQAFTKALEANPELYVQYIKELRGE
jgi:hypothetical protein